MKVVKVRVRDKTQKTTRNQLEGVSQQIPKMLRFKGIIMPQKLITNLKYLSTATLVSATDTASRQFVANGLYDTDPSLASTAISGFAELMALYSVYRVKRVRISTDFINLDSRPTICNVGFENSFFTANTKNYPYFSEPNQSSRLIAGIGGNPVRLNLERSIEELKGDVSATDDRDFAGSVGANPAAPVYVSVAISDPAAYAMTNGAYIRNEITYETEFYGLKNLNA